jgi:VWFA-related protein
MEIIMKRILPFILIAAVVVSAQTPQTPQKPPEQVSDDDMIRVTTSLVQTDVVVTDKNDQIIDDLTLADFKVSENGKKQDVQFLEFVKAGAPNSSAPRTEGTIEVGGKPVEPEVSRNLTSRDLRRVFAFVIDDLTIPYEDIVTVRKILTNFVDTKMQEGDLVAIVRVVGNNDLVQQFTTDKDVLRRAISQISARLHAYSAFNNMVTGGMLSQQLTDAAAAEGPAPNTRTGGGPGGEGSVPLSTLPSDAISAASANLDASEDGAMKAQRTLSTLVAAGEVIDSMKQLPGRKNMVLLSGGLPLFETSSQQVKVGGVPVSMIETKSYYGDLNYLVRGLTDRASRAGVVINTMDVRGLKSQRGVSRFTDPGNEATSALFGGANGGGASFGRQANQGMFEDLSLDTISGHQGLGMLADLTGGISVINTDNFANGLDQVAARSSYYLLAYRPTEPFDGKYHKLEIKVNRPGAKVYSRAGYYAKADTPAKDLTKEQAIVRAARSPLAKRDVNVGGVLQYRFTQDNHAEIDVNLAIDANNLTFKQEADGKYHTTFDVVGFLVNGKGKSEDGFSQEVTTAFTSEEHKAALANGISFTGHASLTPGNYQLRAVVRETATGKLGTLSQYIEVPDMTKKRLIMSSLFLYAVDLTQPNTNAAPIVLNALRQLPRKLDLRYAAIVYNPKLEGGKHQLKSQIFITQGTRVVFKGPEQPIAADIQNGQVPFIGQINLGKARAGRYILTVVITDSLADKKSQYLVRSLDFNLTD